MELTFNKVGKQYEAEFELSADANLHIEFKNAAPVKLYQRTAGSGWDLVNDVKNAVGKATDVDLTSLIYPKFVKVVCVQEPAYATVTTDGEITEIKSQSKEIEITSNGTINVTPDAGFSYLNSVKVNTNVAQSGGGGGSASSADEWIVAIVNENDPNIDESIALLVSGMCINFFQKGDCLQIVRDPSGNKFVSVITHLEDLSDALNSFIVFGGAIRIGATMNDIGDGKVRTFNNKEDYKNVVLELSLLSGCDVTMADVESAVIFLSQNELMSMMSNYGGSL